MTNNCVMLAALNRIAAIEGCGPHDTAKENMRKVDRAREIARATVNVVKTETK